MTNAHPLQALDDIFACGEILSEGARPAQKLSRLFGTLLSNMVKLI